MTSTIKVNNIQNQCGANIINENSNTITLGASGDTVTLASGASQSGFGREGSVDWQTGSIKTSSTFSASNGEGYFVDTSSNTVTANLPAGSAGAIVAFSDYARNFATNKLTVSPNGSEKIGGVNANIDLEVNGQALTLVYVDGTKGWINVQNAEDTETGIAFMSATGGNTTITCGNFKTHIFTGPGTFTVCTAGSSPTNNTVDYLVVGGGGGGFGGGGGAGGFRLFSTAPGSNSPLNNSGASPNTEVVVTATSFPITVGAGGAGTPLANTPPVYSAPPASAGAASTFSSVTSAGGGRAGSYAPSSGTSCGTGGNGGSGGGGGYLQSGGAVMPGGTGNTPSVSPSQGNNGGSGQHVPGVWAQAGGGGGAGAAGTNGTPGTHGVGGDGSYVADSFIGPTAPSYGTPGPVSSTRYFAGGGTGPGPAPAGGGASSNSNGTVNTGGGAGAGTPSGSGGSGIVMIRYRFQ